MSCFVDYHEIIECITSALDAKDCYTANHSARVSEMTLVVCGLLKLSEEETEEIHIAAHLHDIGKIGISDGILNKKGKLTLEEWEKIKLHPVIGANILSKSNRLAQIAQIVLCHHERYDGQGYPNGLKGEDIPLGARIVAICDSIDAMSVSRSYRAAFTLEQCYVEIESQLGKMYDPIIGHLVLKHWEKVTNAIKSAMKSEEVI